VEMPTTEDATMAEPGDKTSRFKLFSHSKKTKKVKDGIVSEGVVNYNFIYLMRILMTIAKPSTKNMYPAMYNPIPKTKTLLMTLANLNHGITMAAIDRKSTLTIATDTFPNTEEQFKKYFTYEWEQSGNSKSSRVRLGCTIHGNQTLNHLKHSTKPSTLITWLRNQQIFLKADTLGIGKTKTVGYLTQIHPRLINRISTKEKLYENLNSTIIDPEIAAKLDKSLQDQVTAMQDTGDDVTVHCPGFKLFQTTIGIGNNPCIKTDVLGIKCQAGKAALVREYLLQSSNKIKQEGLGKFIPAGLANVIGTETMKAIICTNNQYLKSVTTIPINGIPNNSLQMEIIIDDELPENEHTLIKVQDYLLSAEWCLGLEPTVNEG